MIGYYSSRLFYNWLFLNWLDVFQQADTGKQQSSKQTHEIPKTFTEPLIEIPISIEVEQTTTDSSQTQADKIRKQNRQEFVTIQSIDETTISTHDGGLPQTSRIKVGYIQGNDLIILYKITNTKLTFSINNEFKIIHATASFFIIFLHKCSMNTYIHDYNDM